jgi:hypothetical protein
VVEAAQKEGFEHFYSMDRNLQNSFLGGLMARNEPARSKSLPKSKNHENQWTYTFESRGKKQSVCKTFFMSTFQVGRQRLATLHVKMRLGKSLADFRGKHDTRPNKIDPSVWELALAHCKSLPHKASHYCRETTSLNYFSNPELTLADLFLLFEDFYCSITGKELDMSLQTYSMYFNRHLNFSFRQPRTDVCNMCFEHELKDRTGSLTAPEKAQWLCHKKKVAAYNRIKSKILSDAKGRVDLVVLEFDYAQNLPLPKLPVNDQFYKRLMWLYLFNVHVHHSKRSFYFYSIEGSAKKGSNSVCTYLDHTLNQILTKDVKEIILFSDAAGGQNRNYSFLRFCLWKSAVLNIKISHIFPVRGHSYCACDRNFARYSSSLKKKERVEMPDEYVSLIEKATRGIMVEGTVLDYDKELLTVYKLPKNVMISKAVKISYEGPDNSFTLSYSYSDLNQVTLKAVLTTKTELGSIVPKKDVPKQVTAQKKKDVLDLVKYCSAEAKQYYERILSDAPAGDAGIESESDESDLDF